MNAIAERERDKQSRRIQRLKGEQKKLLDAHYAGAVPLDLLKSEQTRISAELLWAEERLATVNQDFERVQDSLRRTLELASDCEAAYRDAGPDIRRLFNQAFFRRLLIDEDCGVVGDLAPPFDTLLGDELRRIVDNEVREDLRQAVDQALQDRTASGSANGTGSSPHGQELALVSAGKADGDHSPVDGWNAKILVGAGGLEPSTSAV
jgi:hypothetical protein